MAKKKATDSEPRKTRGAFANLVRCTVLLLDIILVAALIVTAYAGNISPLQHGGYWGILPLGFPILLTASVLILALHLLWLRAGAVIQAIGLLVCAGPALAVCPLHILDPEVPAGAETFTLMSYNAHQFVPPHRNTVIDTLHNGALEYIHATDADIVCLQEASSVSAIMPGRLTPSQVRSLHKRYPHILSNGDELVVLSKYPLESVHLDSNSTFKGGSASCCRVTLPSGRRFTLFNIHLQSMMLSEEDKESYLELTKGETDELGPTARILRKVSNAAVQRVRETQQLLRYIRLYGGPDVIITGDFNDVPGCYAIRTLADTGFKSAYPEVGFGPMATFNDSRLYFCLDHTLFRGALRPVSMKRGSLRASDHFPITTRFYLLPPNTPVE